MAQRIPDPPEHSPHGHEWLPKAYERDLEPVGSWVRERARQELAEGNVKAILLTRDGVEHAIVRRMWRKNPRSQMVYPRFEDGWMTIKLKCETRKEVEGWIYVPVAVFKHFASLSSRKTRRKSGYQPNLNPWLLESYTRKLVMG